MATSKKAPSQLTSRNSPADAVDEQLARYREMRDFAVTAEPSGSEKPQKKPSTARGLPFVIQKHAASHLHFDFRLGWNGVLKSWAVAKGPSYSTSDRRLAVQVEDHPMEYGGFEGIIPKGQYGGGTVMVWDQGTWWPQPGHENVDAGLRDGSLKFELNGAKMKGKWTLVRMGGKAAQESKPNWLLIKEHDGLERGPDSPAITDEEPSSAVTGRSLEQIAHQEDHVWNSKETARPGQAWSRKPAPGSTEAELHGVKRGRATSTAPAPDSTYRGQSVDRSMDYKKLISLCLKEAQPEFVQPQLALEATAPPPGDGWLHELKLDGYRIQARKSGQEVKLLTRKGLDWTHRMPAVTQALAGISAAHATVDGEVVVLGADGNSSFADLQASFNDAAQHPLTYFCFDLLHLEGRDTRELALRDRKQLLAEILPASAAGDESADSPLRLSEHIETDGAAMFRHACELHAEGIISKRASAPYRGARNGDWLKSKCLREQEFVVGGYTYSTEGKDRIGSLLLGYYDGESAEKPAVKAGGAKPSAGAPAADLRNKLIYAGRTGTGFTQKLKRQLFQQLSALKVEKPAFAKIPAEARRDGQWVRPTLVAQVRFATWTADNLVRQAAFLGLREDKPAAEVRREEPTVAPRPKSGRANESGRPGATATQPELSAATPSGEPARAAPGTDKRQSAKTQSAKPRSAKPRSHWKAAAGDSESQAEGGAAHPAAARIAAKEKEAAGSKAMGRSSGRAVLLPDIRLTHPEKILDPETGLTKRELAEYYAGVADRMLPHIANRPLSLVRCPEGAGKPCFYQKHVNAMLPPGIGSVTVIDKKSGKPEPYITLDSSNALAGLAQMGVLEVHPWGSCNDDLEHPDRLILDLDPDENLAWRTLTEAALEVRARLRKAGLESFLKLTGGKGLHIVAPIRPTLDWTTLKTMAHRFVSAMERKTPGLYLTKMTKAARKDRIYLDYLRNERGATAVAPYSPRARLGTHVSLPLPWSALKAAARPMFTVRNFPEWRDRLRADPWKTMLSTSQQLEPTGFDQL